MDPYLEASWRDVHAALIIYLRDAMQDLLPPALHARVEERIVLELPEGFSGGGLFPDVRITEYSADPTQTAPGGAVATQPIICEGDFEPITEGYIEVIDAGSGNKVVTLIEILSPTNKNPGESMDAYRSKQRQICRSDTNLVEIDLLRGGKHVLAVPLANILPAQRTPYMVCVRRATARGRAEIYPLYLAERLRSIKIPLRPGDEDIVVDLQALVDQVYQRGRYERTIDYNKDPDPPFAETEAVWVDELLRKAGVRTAAPTAKSDRPRRPREKG
jgi:hypothetical protein